MMRCGLPGFVAHTTAWDCLTVMSSTNTGAQRSDVWRQGCTLEGLAAMRRKEECLISFVDTFPTQLHSSCPGSGQG